MSHLVNILVDSGANVECMLVHLLQFKEVETELTKMDTM